MRKDLDGTTATLPDAEWVPSALIIRELEEMTGVRCPVGFRRLIDLAAANRVSLDRRSNRWGAWRSNLNTVARELGMTSPDAPESRAVAHAASAAVPA